MLWNQQGTHRSATHEQNLPAYARTRFCRAAAQCDVPASRDFGYQSQYVLAGGDFVAGRAPEFVHPVQTNALLRLDYSCVSTVALLVKVA